MIADKMAASINAQINAELYSSYLYLSMAAWFESQNLCGMAKWMRVQAKEEQSHAMKFFDYLVDRGGEVKLTAIEAPPVKWSSALAVFGATLEHEKKVTALLNKLADQAQAQKDKPSEILLQWFITEQVEEEANATKIVATLKMIKDSAGGLLQLDHHLGKRE